MSIEMFYSDACPYCKRAKSLLESKNITIKIIDVNQNPENWEVSKARSGRSTVPQIFIYGRHIGGCDDLYELEKQGELDNWLVKKYA